MNPGISLRFDLHIIITPKNGEGCLSFAQNRSIHESEAIGFFPPWIFADAGFVRPALGVSSEARQEHSWTTKLKSQRGVALQRVTRPRVNSTTPAV